MWCSVQGSANMSEGSGSNKGTKSSQGRPPATEIRVPGGVTAAAVSPDGACIATAGVDGVMRIYSMSGGGPTAGFKVVAASLRWPCALLQNLGAITRVWTCVPEGQFCFNCICCL